MNRNPATRRLAIGEVYLMRFTGQHTEQQGVRPGLVFQNNVGNANSPNIIALPLTSSLKKLHMPTHVLIRAKRGGLNKDSMVLCENPECMSKVRIGAYLTTLSDSEMRLVAEASLLATSAVSFLDKATLLSVWEKSVKMNQKSQ